MNMKRPSDQIKFLALGLLRTVSALSHYYVPGWATTSSSTSSSSWAVLASTAVTCSPARRKGSVTGRAWSPHWPGRAGRPSNPTLLLYVSASSSSWNPEDNDSSDQVLSSHSSHNTHHHHHHHHHHTQGLAHDPSSSSSWTTLSSAYAPPNPPRGLESPPRISSTVTNHHPSPTTTTTGPRLQLRLAQRTDVPSLQRCNLATLPENYNEAFYAYHLRTWPELSLVVVVAASEPPSRSTSSSSQHHHHHHPNGHHHDGSDNHYRPWSYPNRTGTTAGGGTGGPIFSSFPTRQAESTVAAYVLGKVEDRIVTEPVLPEDAAPGWFRSSSSHSRTHSSSWTTSSPPAYTTRTERIGHVTSLAVLPEFRRRGLAADLMHQLHVHLKMAHQVDQVGLHVRPSNAAAVRLYQQLGYRTDHVLDHYYQDGEDAFYMTKDLRPLTLQRPGWPPKKNHHHSPTTTSGTTPLDSTPVPDVHSYRATHHQGGGGSGRFRWNRPWEQGPEGWRLPRPTGEIIMTTTPPDAEASPRRPWTGSTHAEEEEEEEEESRELLTGTL